MRRKIGLFLVTLLLLLLFSTCAAQKFNQEADIKVDSSGIATEVADRFAVSETNTIATDSAPEPSKSNRKKQKENKEKKGKEIKNEATPKQTKKGKEFSFELRRKGKLPFGPGERTLMSLTYFGVEAGTLDLRVMPHKYIGGRKTVHIRGHGVSTSVFALFYRVNDIGEAYLDYDGLFTHKFQLKVDESLQKRDLIELYDQKDHKVHYWEKLVHEKKGLRITQFEQDIAEYTHDAVTAAFYLRTMDLEVGKEYTFPVVSNGKPWMVSAKVLRRENLTTELGIIPALVIQPETRFEGVLKKKGDIFFWLSDDKYKNFLKVDAKIKVGSVIAYIKQLQYGSSEE